MKDAHCGLNWVNAGIYYEQAVGGPTYTFNPSSSTTPLLAPDQVFEREYTLEVVNPFEGVTLDIGSPANLDWITMTNPYEGIPLILPTGYPLIFDFEIKAPTWLPEGVYTDTIPIQLPGFSPFPKISYLNIVATQTPAGLYVYTDFDPGELLYSTVQYKVPSFYPIGCDCSLTGPTWTVTGDVDGIIFSRPGYPGAPGLPFLVPLAHGYGHQQVKLEITQNVMLEREAFLASLTLTNTSADSLDDLQVSIVISDTEGNLVTDYFAIAPVTPTDFGNISPGLEAKQIWTLVPGDLPITNANGEPFYVGATISYTLNGVPYVLDIIPTEITVKPSPKLILEYYVPGPGATCTIFPLYLKVYNVGYGWANNLRIASAQPSIVDNPSGLLIDFAITQAMLNDQVIPNGSLTIDFGDLAPGQEKVGSWMLTSSLPGTFVEFSSEFKHQNVLGLSLSPLIQEVNTYIVTPNLTEYERFNRNYESIFLAGQNTAQAGQGVNTFSGFYRTIVQDFSVPTQGLPLKFERSYSSAAASSLESFGHGWTHNYDMHLEFGPGSDVKLISQHGSEMRFYWQGEGEFLPAPGVRADLIQGPTDIYTLTLVNQVRYEFSVDGKLLAELDQNGNRNTMVYEDDQLVAVQALDGRELRIAYNEQSLISSVTDPISRTIGFAYNSDEELTVITDTRGYTTTLDYDDDNRLVRMIDANGNLIVSNEYDEYDRVTQQEDALGFTTQFQYETEDCTIGRTTTMTDTRGFQWVDVYGINGELSTQEDPLGGVITYTYDLNFNISSITDKNDHTTNYVVDERGNPLEVTDALSNTRSSSYDGNFNLIEEVDALGRITTYEYDENDNLITKTNAFSGTAINTYDEYGQLIQTVDPNGNITQYGYDAYGDQTVITDSLGNATYMLYDLVGRPLTITAPGDRITVYSYDEAGHVLTTRDAEENPTVNTYDKAGNLLNTTNARGYTTHYAYDALNRVITTTNALSGTQVVVYDAGGNQIQATDANTNITYSEYDPLNRVITMTNAAGDPMVYTYDPVGNKTSVTNGRGFTTHYEYDPLNRVNTLIDALSGTMTYSYDSVGNPLSVTDALGHVTQIQYDALNRSVKVTDALGNGRPTNTMQQVTCSSKQMRAEMQHPLNTITMPSTG